MTHEEYESLFEQLKIKLKNPRIKKILDQENFDLASLQEAVTFYLYNENEVMNISEDNILHSILGSAKKLLIYADEHNFPGVVHKFINDANTLIEYAPTEIQISEEEFLNRCDKLIQMLKFENEGTSNLILETPSDKVPFQLFKKQNNSIIVLTKNGSKNSMTKDKLANIIYRKGSTKNLSYEPVIIEKILDNSIFDLIQNSNASFYNGNKIEELEDDKFKILGKIQELEEKLKKRENDFDGIESLYTKSKELETNFENAQKAVLEKLEMQESFKFWETQGEEYYRQYRNYIWGSFGVIVLLLILTLIFLNSTHLSFASVISCFTDNNATIKAEEIITRKEIWQYGLLVLSITLTLWFVRILMKIALSNYHLAVDAKERIIMIRTYLSLMQEGKGFEQDDKKVILDNIFRPTNHGIIKDEASITITDILSALKSK